MEMLCFIQISPVLFWRRTGGVVAFCHGPSLGWRGIVGENTATSRRKVSSDKTLTARQRAAVAGRCILANGDWMINLWVYRKADDS
jgi:hypothetical protein